MGHVHLEQVGFLCGVHSRENAATYRFYTLQTFQGLLDAIQYLHLQKLTMSGLLVRLQEQTTDHRLENYTW